MASVYREVAQANSEGNALKRPPTRFNKQKVLLLSSRGVTFRHRHLMNDVHSFLPHSRKDAKFDTKTKLFQLNELADLYNCNNIFFFEARKGKDLYAWMSKAPNGPTVKFHLQNLHTMEELHFTGNCLKGSRPILSFDSTFDTQAHLRVIKELLLHNFSVPKGARKVKPFVDHIMGFTFLDGRIWIRCYQVEETEAGEKQAFRKHTGNSEVAQSTTGNAHSLQEPSISLIEIGPRFVMTPIVILESSFGGPVIYENKEFVSPNQIRSQMRLSRANKYKFRGNKSAELNMKRVELGLKTSSSRRRVDDGLDHRKLFAS